MPARFQAFVSTPPADGIGQPHCSTRRPSIRVNRRTLLVTGQREVIRKLGESVENQLPGVIFRQQHDNISHPLDQDPVDRDGKLLGALPLPESAVERR